MPALIHLALHGFLGCLLAFGSRHFASARARLFSWPLFLGLCYGAAVLLPVSAYQFRFYPDYSLAYTLDPVLSPWLEAQGIWLGAAAAGAYLLALVAGYASTRWALLRRHRLLSWLLPALALAPLAWALLWQRAQSLRVGSYADFWRETALPVSALPSAWVALLAYLASPVLVWQLRRRWRGREPALLSQL